MGDVLYVQINTPITDLVRTILRHIDGLNLKPVNSLKFYNPYSEK